MLTAIRRLIGMEQKASATGEAVAYWTTGQAVYTRRDFQSFAREAYTRNAVSHRCISMIAQCASSVPWLLTLRGEEVEEHPALDLLARPNPIQPGQALLERVYAFLTIAGNSYIEAVGPGSMDGLLRGAPMELYSLRPDRVRVIPSSNALPMAYEYEANGIKVRFPVDPIRGRSPLCHIRTFDPIDDFYGMSSVDPAAYAIDRHTAASDHNQAVLQNGATPSGAMVFRPVKIDGSDANAPQDVIAAAEARITARYAGPKNAGRPMVLGGNVDWLPMGMNAEQLQLIESKLDAARDICIAFGVPIELLLPGQSTYNNRSEAKLSFYEETILPVVERLATSLNHWLLPMYGDGYRLEPNLDAIEALAPKRAKLQESTLALYAGGLISLDEARVALQWDEADDKTRREILAPKLASAAAQQAQAFQVDVNSGIFNEDVLREVRAAQLAELGTYPDAEKLAEEPEPSLPPSAFGLPGFGDPAMDDETPDDDAEEPSEEEPFPEEDDEDEDDEQP